MFEVEHDGSLIFSKKDLGRFPEDGEIIAIVRGLKNGLSLEEASKSAAENQRRGPGFGAWLEQLLHKQKS